MKNYIYILIVIMGITVSCEPRIELDYAEWGDKAYLTNVQIFTLEIDDKAKLGEWYTNQELITGVRRLVISESSVIDNDNFTVTVKLKKGNSLVGAGIIFYHTATLIEPLNNSPIAGILDDLSAKNFTYKVHSADGSHHDWTIIIQE